MLEGESAESIPKQIVCPRLCKTATRQNQRLRKRWKESLWKLRDLCAKTHGLEALEESSWRLPDLCAKIRVSKNAGRRVRGDFSLPKQKQHIQNCTKSMC